MEERGWGLFTPLSPRGRGVGGEGAWGRLQTPSPLPLSPEGRGDKMLAARPRKILTGYGARLLSRKNGGLAARSAMRQERPAKSHLPAPTWPRGEGIVTRLLGRRDWDFFRNACG